jgi:hypothetical protein
MRRGAIVSAALRGNRSQAGKRGGGSGGGRGSEEARASASDSQPPGARHGAHAGGSGGGSTEPVLTHTVASPRQRRAEIPATQRQAAPRHGAGAVASLPPLPGWPCR